MVENNRIGIPKAPHLILAFPVVSPAAGNAFVSTVDTL